MKSKSYFRKTLLQTVITFTMLPAFGHAAETVVDAAVTDLNVGAGTSVWFDSANTNVPIPLQTINGVTPTTGPLPGWAHTRWTFVKYDGTQVMEIPQEEKIVGQVNLGLATANSVYYDNGAATTYSTNQLMGSIETTRDFVISSGATLNVALGGIMFHNNSHWVKTGTGGGFATSSSGTLSVVTNGGQGDYRIFDVIIRDFNATTPLKVIKTGPDSMRFGGANTYTGGTWVNNGRLLTDNTATLGTGLVRVQGANSQVDLLAGGTYANAFEIEGEGWTEGTEKRGAIRFEGGNVRIAGNVLLTGASRMVANTGATGTIGGTLTGTANLEIGLPVTTGAYEGTVTLAGSGSAYTGTVNVTRGRFNANNLLGGSVHVGDLGKFSGTSTITGNLTVGDTTGANLIADPTLPLQVNGNVSFTGANKIGFTLLPTTPGTYPLINYSGTLTGGGNLAFDTASYRSTVVLDTATPGSIRATVSGSGLPLVWTGSAATADWDVNGLENWTNAGTPSKYLQGDAVTFNDSATVTDIALKSLVQPSGVVFNNTDKTYTVNGFGLAIGIVGQTGITKNGTGILNLGGQASTFTGPVAVNGGTLKLLNAEALGFNSGVTIASGAVVDLGGHSAGYQGRGYTWTIEGNGVDGFGAITNTGGNVNQGSGVLNLVLTGDASINTKVARLDIGFANNVGGQITGNNHTLTLNADVGMGVRGDASGSPIHYVVASGRAWAEDTNSAFGGATGTILVKGGAWVGTYGTRTIPTPVTLESGGTLYVEGALGIGTWTGAVTVAGEAIFEAAGQALIVSGSVNGTANVTKTGGNTATISLPNYVGDTTVSAGTLSLGAATLANNSTVKIANTAKLSLTHGQSDAVAALVINDVPMAAGIYGATGSGATIIDDAHFAGNGRLVVGGGGGAYGAWAEAFGVGGPEEDDDNDGIDNGIEFIIGGNPTIPGDRSLLPTSVVTETSLVFTFRRMPDAASYNPVVDFSSDLVNWTPATPSNSTITVNDATNPPTVTVTIPKPASPITKLFARLRLP